jgi:NAD(P)-dependent dehydrogenase (short-subunit alcohol dehydrogenase family)
VAHQLLEQGAEIVSFDLRAPQVAVESHFSVDLSNHTELRSAVDELRGDFDGLINVAGVPDTFPAETVFSVNFLALRFLTEQISPRLRPGGSVVNVSSTAGFRWASRTTELKDLMATDGFEAGLAWFRQNRDLNISPYSLSKEAVTFFTLQNAIPFRHKGFRINAVAPAATETPLLPQFEKSMGKEGLDAVKALMGRNGRPEESASAIVFLSSDESSWINGQQLTVDGGLTAGWASGAIDAPGTPATTPQLVPTDA